MSSQAGRTRAIYRIVDPRLLQKSPIIALILLTTIVHIVSSIDLSFSRFEIRIPLAILSMLPALLIIKIGHSIAAQNSRGTIPIVFSAYLIGGVIRGWILESGLYRFNVLEQGSTNFRISTGAVVVAGSASVISYAWSTLNDAWLNIKSLHQENSSLNQILDNLKIELETRDIEQSMAIFQKITNELSIITDSSSATQKVQLENLVNKVVKPLSRTYAPNQITERIKPTPELKISWPNIWVLLDPVRHIPSFRNVVIALAIAAATPVRRLYGWGTAFELGAWVIGSLYLSIYLIYPISQKALKAFSSPRREIVLTLGFILIAIPPSFATTIALADTSNPRAYFIPGIVTLPIFAWILTIGNAAWEYSQNIKTELETIRNQLRWSLARLNLISWYKRGLISRLLHGPVQNTLQVAIMQIRAGDVDGGNADVLNQVISRIDSAVSDATDEKRSAKDDLAAMRTALSNWQVVAEIEMSLPDSVEQSLIKDPAGCAIFTDLVMEACSNSIRHGNSTKLVITSELTADGIKLQISDNGKWSSDVETLGLGSELISSCSIWHERKTQDGWNKLTLELPLDVQLTNASRVHK